ncbi:tail fiber domain-containing protein [Sediminibacterium goheungense]|uniref:Endosialidase-like protein n=1 Tax=Sediminibacterium goheungense TaxID=1086393 RepID=A0A4R6IZF3_9BACT|nr:tail fiber domain-containing protein [Sediminibacterium goheungense]TDO28269.1 endosialidase-like protein [Sediminibacterium goheungense]
MKNQIKLFFAALLIVQVGISQDMSDTELKKYIRPVNDATSQLGKLKPQAFEYKAEYNKSLKLPAGRQFGFGIENVEAVFPQLIKSKTISYTAGKNFFKQAYVKEVEMEGLIPVLVASVKELQEQILQLKAEIQALKK